jgi:type I restriction enzyme M protein
LPGEAFQHSGANVKASLLFVRRRGKDEQPDQNEAVFMAAPENIGYDATGRPTIIIEVLQTDGHERLVRKRHDLFSYEVNEVLKDGVWDEAGPRSISVADGVVGAWTRFKKDPSPFFA